jgi:hypothetical protein
MAAGFLEQLRMGEIDWKRGVKNEEPPGREAGGTGKREERGACPT